LIINDYIKERRKKMKARKKLIAGLMAAMIITTIGAVYATEQTDGATTNTTPQKIFRDKQDLNRTMPFECNLTAEQQTELQELLTTLRDQNATPQQIRAAIQEKLDEFGVFDMQLETQIAQTQQRLAILNREKELRGQGYNWTEIQTIIQNEFNLQNTTYDPGMIYEPGFGCEPRGRGHGFPSMGNQNNTGDGQHMRNGYDFGRGPNGGCGDFNLSATTEK
jgi:Spy/CpxP family protein refolding chaperone